MIDKNIAKELESPFYTLYEIKKGDSLYKISKEIAMINGGKTKYKDILNKIQKKDEEHLRSIFKSDVSYLTLKKRFITLKNKQKNVAQ